MAGRIIMFATVFAIRLPLLDFSMVWIPGVSVPPALRLCSAAFSGRTLMTAFTLCLGKPASFFLPVLPMMKEPRGETFEFSSRGFHSVADMIDDFFQWV
jgi:hypothetical protein